MSNRNTATINRANLNPLAFTLMAIDAQKAINASQGKPQFKGIHVIYGGFNASFKILFPHLDPREETAKMALAGTIRIFPVRGGAMLMRPEDVTERTKIAKVPALLTTLGLA